jgi:thiol peroxidase
MARTTTLRGNPLPLDGPELKPGDAAPDATVSKDLATEVKLSAYAGKTRILSVVPSLDTPVCALQTKRFNEEAAKLPTAQARFCGAENIDKEKLIVLSDHRRTEFGKSYGTLIPTLRILSRAVFVVGPDNTIAYAEYVPEVAHHPNYDAALAAARSIA